MPRFDPPCRLALGTCPPGPIRLESVAHPLESDNVSDDVTIRAARREQSRPVAIEAFEMIDTPSVKDGIVF
jgi:hypothetical protein